MPLPLAAAVVVVLFAGAAVVAVAPLVLGVAAAAAVVGAAVVGAAVVGGAVVTVAAALGAEVDGAAVLGAAVDGAAVEVVAGAAVPTLDDESSERTTKKPATAPASRTATAAESNRTALLLLRGFPPDEERGKTVPGGRRTLADASGGSPGDRIGRSVPRSGDRFHRRDRFGNSGTWASPVAMADFQDIGGDEISTAEVLRAGEIQLESSRAVLDLLDDALRKGADIVTSRPAATAGDHEARLVEEPRSDVRRSTHDSWRS
jgi:hypothetical protein